MEQEGKTYKIDLHTHILPKEWPDLRERYGYGGFIRLQHCQHKKTADMWKDDKFFREVEPNCWSPEERMKDCDRDGVTVQVLSTVPVMFSYWAKPEDTLDLCQIINDDIAKTCRKYPKRFVGLGTLPMQAPELAIKELHRCINELGLCGIQIGTHINDWNLDAPELFPIFQAAERLGAAIFVHPWDMMGKESMEKYWLPWLVGMPAESSRAICSLIFGGVFERLPRLKFCFAHGGGSFPNTIGRIEHGHRCRPDLVAVDNEKSPREYLGKFWLDSLTHDDGQLDIIVKLMGEDKILLGTDYPFPLGEWVPGKLIESMDWPKERKDKLLWKNCLSFLGLNEKDFLEAQEEEEEETAKDSSSISPIDRVSSALSCVSPPKPLLIVPSNTSSTSLTTKKSSVCLSKSSQPFVKEFERKTWKKAKGFDEESPQEVDSLKLVT